MSNIYGRQVVVPLTNKSGGAVAAGDVVIIDTTNNDAFTTTTSASFTGVVGVAQETIANNATGRVLTSGYAALINVPSSVTRGHYAFTHTVAKQATGSSSRAAGAFGQFLTGGTTPDAHVFGITDSSVTGLSDPMTTRGDVIVRNASNVTARLAIGSSGKVLSSDGTDISWQTPSGGAGNLWSMNKSSSQTLTSSTDTLITWDTTLINGGSSVIDLANEQFVVAATGFYMAFATWLWEGTAPDTSGTAMACYVNGSDNKAARCRLQTASPMANGGAQGHWALSLTAADTVKLYINPGATTPTARGNASAQIATSFTLLRVT